MVAKVLLQYVILCCWWLPRCCCVVIKGFLVVLAHCHTVARQFGVLPRGCYAIAKALWIIAKLLLCSL